MIKTQSIKLIGTSVPVGCDKLWKNCRQRRSIYISEQPFQHCVEDELEVREADGKATSGSL